MDENQKKKNNNFINFINNADNKKHEETRETVSSCNNLSDDFGDFEFDVDGFESDQQLSIVDEVALEIIEKIIFYASKIKENIKYQEKSDARANYNILTNYCTGMAEIMAEDGNTDEEILEKIRELKIQVADITYENMNKYAEEFKEIHGVDVLDICEDSEEKEEEKDDDDLF